VPFCGSYTQHNTWTDAEKAEFQYFQEKRRVYAAVELESFDKGRSPVPETLSAGVTKTDVTQSP